MKKLILILQLLSLSLFADLAIVVSSKSSLDSISKAQVKRIFLGKSTRLPNGEKAIAIEDKTQKYKDLFYKKIANKSGGQLRSYWAKIIFSGRGVPPKQIDIKEVKKLILESSRVITYVPIQEVDSSMKILLEIK